MTFIQTFQLDLGLCDFISGNLQITTDEKCIIEADIEEVKDPIEEFARQYLANIAEFNYFGSSDDVIGLTVKDVRIMYIPPWNYQMYIPEHGDYLNFYIFLEDNQSVFEVFNPFIKDCFRVTPRKGLVVILPAIWMMLTRHTDTFDGRSVIIRGTIDVNNLNNMQ